MMTTYFNGGSEIQADNLQTLFLMNRGGYAAAASFSDAPQAPPGVLLHNLPQGPINHNHNQHHLLGIPLSGDDPSAAGPRFHYNLWGGGGEPHIPTAIAINGGGGACGELGSPMGFRRPAPVTAAVIDHQQLHQQQQQQGGLSLSLNNSSPHKTVAGTMTILSPGSGTPTSTASAVTTGVAACGSPGLIMGSKYLKAAQQLLDEVVNVGKAVGSKDKAKAVIGIGTGEGSSSGGGGGGGDETGSAKGVAVELTTAQRQELQMKKAKLLNMLDEVDQRYRQYHSQMQMVAASFEQAAGGGSAKTYTALALQTISKQFRCLRDAIGEQIKSVGRSMGEEEDEEEGKGRSRLRMVEHQLRQQRALQQLGMMHHNAWRPQRGLPERAVSVLRAWLFEHFLHPYPKDSDKHLLAKQTGLTRSQVSNWFINARVRLWKPMVEEMYVEEMKSNELNGLDNDNNNNNNNVVHTSTANDHNQDSTMATKSSAPLHSSRHAHHPIIDKPNHNYNQNPQHVPDLLAPPPPNDVVVGPLQGFSLVEMDPMSPKRQRMMIPSDAISSPMDKEMKPVGRDLFPPDLGGYGSYPIGEIGSRFNPDHHHHHQLGQQQHQYHHGNTVSLTLGLPHDPGQGLSLAGNHHNHHHHHQQQNFLHSHQAMHSADAGGGYDFVT